MGSAGGARQFGRRRAQAGSCFRISGRGCGGFEPAAGLDVEGRELHQAPLKARAQLAEFYALKTSDDSRV